LNHRLRQHNGEIKEGARYTRGKSWRVLCYVSGFENMRQALQFEWKSKRPCSRRGRRKPGVTGVLLSFTHLFNMEKWTDRSTLCSSLQLTLHLFCDTSGVEINVLSNITVTRHEQEHTNENKTITTTVVECI